jgi:hypothetical protein
MVFLEKVMVLGGSIVTVQEAVLPLEGTLAVMTALPAFFGRMPIFFPLPEMRAAVSACCWTIDHWRLT